jgi:hypothetical protein
MVCINVVRLVVSQGRMVSKMTLEELTSEKTISGVDISIIRNKKCQFAIFSFFIPWFVSIYVTP